MPFEENVHVLDLLPDFVVDALTADETIQVVDHVEGCPTCREELRRLQQVADDLPLALVQTSPPPRVKEGLMSSIHEKHIGTMPSAQAVSAKKRGFNLQRYLPVLGLAVLLVLAVVNVVLWRQLYSTNQQVASQFQMVALTNTQKSPGAIGQLVLDPHGQYGTLVVDDLAPLGSASQYQVWLIKGGERASGGVFSVNLDGYAAMELYAPRPLNSYDSVGISIEPYGGSPAPTGDRVLGGVIPH